MLLAFDSCFGHGSAAVLDEKGRMRVVHLPEPSRQAEWLVPLIENVLEEGGYGSVTKIAVTVGPGSFTSVRIGLAIAHGLRLALGVEAVGYSTLDCLLFAAPEADAVLIDASRGQCYWQQRGGKPNLSDDAVIADTLNASSMPRTLAGTGIVKIRPFLTHLPRCIDAQPDAAMLVQLAASGKGVALPLEALYIRPPDAKQPTPLLGANHA